MWGDKMPGRRDGHFSLRQTVTAHLQGFYISSIEGTVNETDSRCCHLSKGNNDSAGEIDSVNKNCENNITIFAVRTLVSGDTSQVSEGGSG